MLRKVFIFISFLIICNLIILDLWIMNQSKNIFSASKEFNTPISIQVTPMLDPPCGKSCITKINEATASIQLQKTVVTIAQTQPQQVTNVVKEYFVPLGAGTNAADEWEDVPGLRVSVDTNQYGKIKSVVFEATVRVPSLDQWAKVRLYNVTDKHPVWSSEVNFTIGSQPTLLTSAPFTLDTGVKTYQVQMKTQIRHTAYLDQSRIHITTY